MKSATRITKPQSDNTALPANHPARKGYSSEGTDCSGTSADHNSGTGQPSVIDVRFALGSDSGTVFINPAPSK